MTKQARTRNRTPKPEWSWSGLDELAWRSEPSNVVWCQQDTRYKELMTVLTNERRQAFMPCNPPITENRALGRAEGFEIALSVLARLATLSGSPQAREQEPTYPVEASSLAVEPPFVD